MNSHFQPDLDTPVLEIDRLAVHFDVSQPLISRLIKRLSKSYVRAVDGVSFQIMPGQTFSLVGESGCGKSTVARTVAGLITPTGGKILLEGREIFDRNKTAEPSGHGLQMIFQDPYSSLDPRWRVFDIIAEPIRSLGLIDTRSEISEKVDELLTKVGLSPKDREKYPHEFSGGQRQRISIARALSTNPAFLICDEPTSALDVSVQAQILNLMGELQSDLGLTLLFISHDLAVIDHVSDVIGVMYLGRLCEIAPRNALFAAALHPYSKMLLDSVPDISGKRKSRPLMKGEVPNPIDPPRGCAFHPRCPLARDRCTTEVPKPIERDGSKVACHAVEEGWG